MEIQVLRRVLERNDRAADENRHAFDERGVVCVNLIGGAGCGKTALLEALLPRLRGRLDAAVLEGDLATTRDAERIAAIDVPVAQLLTDGGCHLTAPHVQRGAALLADRPCDLLVIENVGNPICPANFDLGEHLRLAVLSVAEGADKPAKYPLLFARATAIVVSKLDLLPHCDVNLHELCRDLRRVNPAARLFLTAARRGHGIGSLARWLIGEVERRHAGTTSRSGLVFPCS